MGRSGFDLHHGLHRFGEEIWQIMINCVEGSGENMENCRGFDAPGRGLEGVWGYVLYTPTRQQAARFRPTSHARIGRMVCAVSWAGRDVPRYVGSLVCMNRWKGARRAVYGGGLSLTLMLELHQSYTGNEK